MDGTARIFPFQIMPRLINDELHTMNENESAVSLRNSFPLQPSGRIDTSRSRTTAWPCIFRTQPS